MEYVIEKQEILPEFWFLQVHLDQINAAQLSIRESVSSRGEHIQTKPC